MSEEQYLDTADAIAQTLVGSRVDPNEVASVLTSLRDMNDGKRFFLFLETVVREGQAVVRSGRTLDYYRHILEVCLEHLTPYEEKPDEMARILGWAIRLMRYYRVEGAADRGMRTHKRTGPRRPGPPVGGRKTGQVKFFREDKGFGFIAPEGGGKDVFVHKSQLSGGLTSLSSGQRVTYEVGQGRKGPEARDVRPA
jgi:cold shock CspA family protein